MRGTIGLPRSYGCHILGAVTHRNHTQKSENVSFGKVSVGLRYTFHFSTHYNFLLSWAATNSMVPL